MYDRDGNACLNILMKGMYFIKNEKIAPIFKRKRKDQDGKMQVEENKQLEKNPKKKK